MKTCFIVNPRSGRALRALEAVRAFAAKLGADVRLTERARHASELADAALAAGCERIVAVGGDGTMNEIASRLVGTSAVLGLVPCGSGDGLGRHLKIHGSLAHVFDVLERGEPRTIDTGVADGHAFFTAAGIGFEAEIAQRFNALQRRGFLRYLTTSARLLRQWEPQRFAITHAGGREELRGFTLAVGNSDQYGNDAIIAPHASVTDGALDLTAIGPVHLWNAVPLLIRLFTGMMADGRNARRWRGAKFVVERAQPGPLHTDGEVHEAGRVIEFVVRPASLRVMCPRA